jgi:hypothetical protein
MRIPAVWGPSLVAFSVVALVGNANRLTGSDKPPAGVPVCVGPLSALEVPSSYCYDHMAECGTIPYQCYTSHLDCGGNDVYTTHNSTTDCGTCADPFVCKMNVCVPPVDLTNVTFGGDSSNGNPTGSISSVSCDTTSVSQQVALTFDANLVPALAGQTTFNWHVSSGSMTLSTMAGETIYQNLTDIVFPVLPEASFPTPTGALCTQSYQPKCVGAIVMTGTDPKYPGTLTATGAYACPGTVNTPPDMAGASPTDMAASGPPPSITSVYEKTSNGNVTGRGPVSAIIYITGTNLVPSGVTFTPGSPSADVGVIWGSGSSQLASGSVYIQDTSTLQTSVPNAPAYGVVPLVVTNRNGQSAAFSFNISCSMTGEPCGNAPGMGANTGCCGGITACGAADPICN